MKARTYVKQLMKEAGLTVREDTMGNIFGRLPGPNPSAPAVATGSHTDAIPLAGAYDGTTGGCCWGVAWLLLACGARALRCQTSPLTHRTQA